MGWNDFLFALFASCADRWSFLKCAGAVLALRVGKSSGCPCCFGGLVTRRMVIFSLDRETLARSSEKNYEKWDELIEEKLISGPEKNRSQTHLGCCGEEVFEDV